MTAETDPSTAPDATTAPDANANASAVHAGRWASMLPGSRRARLVIVVVLVVALLAAVGAVVALGLDRYRQTQAAAAAEAGMRAATDLTPVLLSYDWRTIDADAARIAGASTGRFADENRAILSGLIRPAALDAQAVSKATVSTAALVSSEPGSAVALVYFTQTTTMSTLPGPRIDNRSARVTVVQADDGRWLVSGFDAV